MTLPARTTLETLPELVAAIHPAVVYVEASADVPLGSGSGFALLAGLGDGALGLIVTNAHVVTEATELRVRFNDDSEQVARLRCVDESTDLAILEVDRPATFALEVRPLAEIRVGEPVMAIGSPYGMEGSVTTGIVSGLDRTRPSPSGVPIDNMIQTDAIINPGNSGGPLIGLDGRVLGVNSQIRLDDHAGWYTGMGFAVPAQTAQAIAREVLETGTSSVRRGTLGIATVHRQFVAEERARWGQRGGALVAHDPAAETPGHAAGLRQGDVIVSFDGERVDEPGDLFRLLDRTRIERDCALSYIRNGMRIDASVVPGERASKPTKEE
jgi:S1-C subfamily serine protease